ncbi:hypothetical protein [Streptomyces sp. NPDC053755]|uniref:hypothetical protein n=1 Tax=Streptomyces sp. NPDC053755 TaxID=3155815 RepID=UPI00342BC195
MEFGLLHLAGTFDRYWRQEVGSDTDVLMAYATGMPAYLVHAVVVDAVRLTDSAVPDWAIETLWSLGTEERHVLRKEGEAARDWLRLVSGLYQDHLRTHAPDSSTDVAPSPYVHLTGAVLDEVRLVMPLMPDPPVGPISKRYIPGVGRALEQVALQACPDLAFRFLLEALRVLGPQISRGQFDRYRALGVELEYDEFFVAGCYDHLVSD